MWREGREALRIFGLSPAHTMEEWANREATPLSISAFLLSRFANLNPHRLSPRQTVFFSHRTAGAGDIGPLVFTGGGADRHAALPRWATRPIVSVTVPRT